MHIHAVHRQVEAVFYDHLRRLRRLFDCCFDRLFCIARQIFEHVVRQIPLRRLCADSDTDARKITASEGCIIKEGNSSFPPMWSMSAWVFKSSKGRSVICSAISFTFLTFIPLSISSAFLLPLRRKNLTPSFSIRQVSSSILIICGSAIYSIYHIWPISSLSPFTHFSLLSL